MLKSRGICLQSRCRGVYLAKVSRCSAISRSVSTSVIWNTSSCRQIQPQLQCHGRCQAPIRPYSTAKADDALKDAKKTPLYDLHVKNKASMTEFGGHAMPQSYADQNIIQSTLWTRKNASIFDVSHMTQHKFVGQGAAEFLATITPSSVTSLGPFQSTYSTLLNDDGGIVDDTIVTNISEAAPTYYVVTNAANHDIDLAYFQSQLEKFNSKSSKPVSWEVVENTGLIALQGPAASQILKSLKPKHDGKPFDLDSLTFGHAAWLTFHPSSDGNVNGYVLVSRTGYTGEDGFEISIPHPEPTENATLNLTNDILTQGTADKVRLAGLGARDALRLEAGLCLHGHDLDETRTPIDAALVWIIPKARRNSDGGFNGAGALYDTESSSAKPVRRVGILMDGKQAAREGCGVFLDDGGDKEIGTVTSGAPSPTLDKCIAMGYLDKENAKVGTKIWVKIRNKLRPAQVVKMPFVSTKYYKGPGKT